MPKSALVELVTQMSCDVNSLFNSNIVHPKFSNALKATNGAANV